MSVGQAKIIICLKKFTLVIIDSAYDIEAFCLANLIVSIFRQMDGVLGYYFG
jgi:hypothetical protein